MYLHDGIYVDAKYITLGLAPTVEEQLKQEFRTTYKLKAEKLKPWTHYDSTSAVEEAEKIIKETEKKRKKISFNYILLALAALVGGYIYYVNKIKMVPGIM
mgnify:CR=1 FL=1